MVRPATRSCFPSLSLLCAFSYITALTDSEEEELSDSEQDDQDQPEDELYILLQRIDRLHQGTDSDKRESLHILLEHREQVGNALTFL